jgi:hypothetical protein
MIQNRPKEIVEITAGTICGTIAREIKISIINTKAKKEQAITSKYALFARFLKTNRTLTIKPKI